MLAMSKSKYDSKKPMSSIQPLQIPNVIWEKIVIDFIISLPNYSGKLVILVEIDRLSKYAHFLALLRQFITITLAKTIITNICKLHRLPKVT